MFCGLREEERTKIRKKKKEKTRKKRKKKLIAAKSGLVGMKGYLKGGESSSQFQWFTIAKIELQFLIFFALILRLRLHRYSTNTKRCPPKKVFGNSEF